MPQQRAMHTISRRPNFVERSGLRNSVRNIHIQQEHASNLLGAYGIGFSEQKRPEDKCWVLGITIDRSANRPFLVAGRITDPKSPRAKISKTPLSLGRFPQNQIEVIAKGIRIGPGYEASFADMVTRLVRLFEEKEASALELEFHQANEKELEVYKADLTFDDAAFKSAKRQEDIQALRNTKDEVPGEVEAEKDGIVYIRYNALPYKIPKNPLTFHPRLPGNGKIGTLGIPYPPPPL